MEKKVGLSLFRICVEWDVWRFVWVSLLFCIYSINIYININCCTLHSEPSLHACGFPPSPNAFCSSVWFSWWIHSCFCLMKANSCNMQELWPGNKNDCTCAASVMCPVSTGAELELQDHPQHIDMHRRAARDFGTHENIWHRAPSPKAQEPCELLIQTNHSYLTCFFGPRVLASCCININSHFTIMTGPWLNLLNKLNKIH